MNKIKREHLNNLKENKEEIVLKINLKCKELNKIKCKDFYNILFSKRKYHPLQLQNRKRNMRMLTLIGNIIMFH